MLSYSKLPEFLSGFNIVKDKIGCKFKKNLRHGHWWCILLLIRPFYNARAPVRLCLPVTQESTKSLKALLVLHAKTFELTKPSIMQVIILK